MFVILVHVKTFRHVAERRNFMSYFCICHVAAVIIRNVDGTMSSHCPLYHPFIKEGVTMKKESEGNKHLRKALQTAGLTVAAWSPHCIYGTHCQATVGMQEGNPRTD